MGNRTWPMVRWSKIYIFYFKIMLINCVCTMSCVTIFELYFFKNLLFKNLFFRNLEICERSSFLIDEIVL